MKNYRYTISIKYMHKTGKNKYSEYTFTTMNIKNLVIHSDYDNNNMPVILLDLALHNNIADLIVNTQNIQNDYMILDISKIDLNDEFNIEVPYIKGAFNYYTYEQPDKYSKVDDDPYNTRIIRVGLIKSECITTNSTAYNGVFANTTMQDIVQYCLNISGVASGKSSNINMLIEQFEYNTKFDQIIIEPKQSLSQLISYLNNMAVFYRTPYRFFIDFDTAYLISSSGNAVPKTGESITSILFDIGDIDNMSSRMEGMDIIKKRNLYYIPVQFKDCNIADNYITSQQYSNIATISSSGGASAITKLDIRSGDNSVSALKTIRIDNDNEHMIENIASKLANSNTFVSIEKVGLDNSIFTPNKEFSIQFNNTYDESHNGKYLLVRKQEIFLRDGNSYSSSVLLNLAKIGS